jgi:hypothetical protein
MDGCGGGGGGGYDDDDKSEATIMDDGKNLKIKKNNVDNIYFSSDFFAFKSYEEQDNYLKKLRRQVNLDAETKVLSSTNHEISGGNEKNALSSSETGLTKSERLFFLRSQNDF